MDPIDPSGALPTPPSRPVVPPNGVPPQAPPGPGAFDAMPPGPPAGYAPPPPDPTTGLNHQSDFTQQSDLSTDTGRDPSRAWWGVLGSVLAIPFVLVVAGVGAVAAMGIVAAMDNELGFDDFSNAAALPASILVIGGLIQQAAQFVWPLIVSKVARSRAKTDWWFTFKSIDIAWGLLLAILIFPLSLAVSSLVGWLVDIEDQAASDNTAFLTDNSDSPWLIGLIFMVVIGAPLSEELFFRGLFLQAFRWLGGPVVGVLVSSVAFMLPHFPTSDFTWDGVLVLWATIFTIGLVLGIATLKFKRLAPAIIAHILFNTAGVIGALAAG